MVKEGKCILGDNAFFHFCFPMFETHFLSAVRFWGNKK